MFRVVLKRTAACMVQGSISKPEGGMKTATSSAAQPASSGSGHEPRAASPGRLSAGTGSSGLLLWQLLLVLATVVVYGPTLDYPLVYDDILNVLHNPSIRSLWPPWTPLVPTLETTYAGRPVTNWTFALSFAVSGVQPWAHRGLNLLIHLGCALTLLALARRVLATGMFRRIPAHKATAVAGCAAFVWAMHPLDTSAVTYITQRAESLMSLFFLLTLYCSWRALTQEKRGCWPVAAGFFCLLGAGSKEVIVVAPVLVLLFDWLFVSGGLLRSLRRSPLLYGALAVAVGLLLALVFSGRQARAGSLMETPDALGYALTQAEVVVHYLKQIVWPLDLVFDYQWQPAGLSEVWPHLLLLGAILVVILWGLFRRRGWAFLAAGFFLCLAPTSSFLPIPLYACEYRLYLPLVFVALLLVCGVFSGLNAVSRAPSLPLLVCLALGVVLGGLAWERNQVYASPLLLWQDTARKQPRSPVALFWLGDSLLRARMPHKAVEPLERSVRLRPGHHQTLDKLGLAYYLTGRPKEALQRFRRALELQPGFRPAREHLVIALLELGETAQAREALKELERRHGVTPLSRRLQEDIAERFSPRQQGGQQSE